MKYLLLDVAGTLLHKSALFGNILNVLEKHGHSISMQHLRYNHKMMSEVIKFPDSTDQAFYSMFNSELLYSMGIIPTRELLADIFAACTYLPWEKFDDTSVLDELNVPMGIASNFNSSLGKKLNDYFGDVFSDIFVSEILGIAKPSVEFYRRALEKIPFDPNDIVYVGDSFKLDYEPAKIVGLNVFVIDRDNYFPNNPKTIKSLFELKNMIS